MISSVKIDPELAEKLLEINENNRQLAEFTTLVRPWIGDNAKKPSINLLTQFALYKCMHEKCIFSTNSEELWKDHMEIHIKMIDSLTKDKNRLQKSDRNELKKFRKCCYCERECKGNYDVTHHMSEEHRKSIFQCAYCFYRCVEMDSIIIHNETYHPTQEKEILLCGAFEEKRDFDEKDENILNESHQYIKRIKCGQSKR